MMGGRLVLYKKAKIHFRSNTFASWFMCGVRFAANSCENELRLSRHSDANADDKGSLLIGHSGLWRIIEMAVDSGTGMPASKFLEPSLYTYEEV